MSALRKLMAISGVNGYIVPTSDAHNSEYVRNCDKRRAYISGFTGSAGTAVITESSARLWTDGRYFLQASEELGPEWTLMKDRLKGTPTIDAWLSKELEKDMCVGYDPNVVSVSLERSWRKTLESSGITLSPINQNLIDQVWGDLRPAAPTEPFIHLPVEFSGKLAGDKLIDLRRNMGKAAAADVAIVTALDDVAWMLNIRGTDIEYNPVAVAFLLVTQAEAILCTNSDQVEMDGPLGAHFHREGIAVAAYEEFPDVLKRTVAALDVEKARIWLDARSCNAAVHGAASECGDVVEDPAFPVALAKAIKNETEIAGMARAHLRDGAALVSYLAWLEWRVGATTDDGEGPLDEVAVADELMRLRSQNEHYRGLSFETISSSGPNGAIIHYAPKRDNCRALDRDEMYLCDSGAQYMDGTTDVTRTVHHGTPTAHEKRCFTRVLQGHIALASAVFPAGTPGYKLDILARLPLFRDGLDYRHGTGHGVGAFLNVHEGPHGIGSSPRSTYKGGLQAGMTTSNEPGYYEDGKFGIRIENVVVVEPCKTAHKFGGTEYLHFRNLTMAPIQRKLIDADLLSPEEIAWLDEYHRECRDSLLPFLDDRGDDRGRKYLLRETEPVLAPL